LFGQETLIKTLLRRKQTNIIRRTAISKKAALLLVFIFLASSFTITAEPVSAATQVENSWTSKAPMPKDAILSGAKAAVADGKIYLAGGSVNYEYNPTTDNWTARTPMPTPETGFSIAAYQNKIYLIGSSFNEVYDSITDTWQSKTPMPTSILSASANVVNGKIYVISGYTSDYETIGLNQVYDIANDSWTTKTSIPTPVVSCASAASGGKIFIMGGQNQYLRDNMNVNLNQVYDPATDSWSLGAPLPTLVLGARAGATTGVMAPERIYIFGGGLNGEIGGTNATQVYNPHSNSWTYGADMPIERVAFSVAVVNDLLYAIGGERAITAPFFGNVDQYTPFGYDFSPRISVLSPESNVYNESSVALIFRVTEPASWMGYSLDGQDNVTVSGNATLSGLSSSLHNVTVYANDTAGNMGVSETIKFTIALVIHVLSPERRTYDTSSIPLNFTVNSALAQITYCLNGEKNSTISGNTTLTGLANGDYALTVYAKDYAGNVGTSETILFTVDVPFPTTLVIASVITVAVVGVGLLVYFKKRKR
jgi:N-acetylneuraminic acid mutarotase